MQQPHVFLSRRLEQCKAHTRRQQAGVGARGSARPLLHEGRDQEISGQGQNRSEQGAHTDARHGSVPPVMSDSLTKEERTKANASLMFLKEKRDHLVKVRMCANGQKHRGD